MVDDGDPNANGSPNSRDEFSVIVYECSGCMYRTINRSNLNTHIKLKCHDSKVRKRRGIVRVLDELEPAPAGPLPDHVAEDGNYRRLRQALDGRVHLGNIDERVTFFMYSDEGRRVMLEIFSKTSLLDQFLTFIQYYAGNRAPTTCRSIVKYGTKGKSLAVVREREVTFPRLRRCVIVDLLIELYEKFENMCEQPSFRSDVPLALKTAAADTRRTMDRPLDRPNRKRAIKLAEILDTRRTDDDVMAVLISEFPKCISFIDL